MKSAKQIISSITALGMSAVCLAGTCTGFADTPLPLGDVNGDSVVNASDAAQVLIAAAKIGAGGESGLTAEQIDAADVNHDGIVNASDAALILVFAAYIGAGGSGTLEEYLDQSSSKPDAFNAGTWKMGEFTAYAGDVVTIPVTMDGMDAVMNSYIAKLKLPPELTVVGARSAEECFDFVYNPTNLTFAGTNYTASEVNTPFPSNTPIFYVEVKVPADAANTRYALEFETVTVCSIDMLTARGRSSSGYIGVN